MIQQALLQESNRIKRELNKIIESTENMKKRMKEIEENINEMNKKTKRRWKPKIDDIGGNIDLLV